MVPALPEIGYFEQVTIIGEKGRLSLEAKVDTGAARTSIDMRVAAKVGAGPIVGTILTRSALHKRRRILAVVMIQIRGETLKVDAAVEDRSALSHKVLLGKDVLERGRLTVVPAPPTFSQKEPRARPHSS